MVVEDGWGHAPRLGAPRSRGAWIGLVLAAAVVASVAAWASLGTDATASGHKVSVWILPGTSSSRQHAILVATRAVPGVSGCRFHSQAEDYLEAKRILTSSELATLTPASTPSSVRCVAVSQQDVNDVIVALSGTAGVLTVTAPRLEGQVP